LLQPQNFLPAHLPLRAVRKIIFAPQMGHFGDCVSSSEEVGSTNFFLSISSG
jgi:hypothetical protein